MEGGGRLGGQVDDPAGVPGNRVDHIRAPRLPTRCSRQPRADFIQIFDAAPLEQPRELRLRSAPPRLTQHASWDDRTHPPFESTTMERPQVTIVAFARDQGSCVASR